MDYGDLVHFRSVLEKMRREIAEKGQLTAAGIAEGLESCADLNDRASREADRDFQLLMQSRDLALAREIAEALGRMAEGTYGVCDECGENIGLPRLRAQPMATLCIACKSHMEVHPLSHEAATV